MALAQLAEAECLEAFHKTGSIGVEQPAPFFEPGAVGHQLGDQVRGQHGISWENFGEREGRAHIIVHRAAPTAQNPIAPDHDPVD